MDSEEKRFERKFHTSQEEVKNAVALRELVVRGMIKRKAWDVVGACRIAGETDERCRAALKHIRKVYIYYLPFYANFLRICSCSCIE